MPASYALAGPVAGWLDPRETLIGAGLLGSVITLAFLFTPGMCQRAGRLEHAGRQPH